MFNKLLIFFITISTLFSSSAGLQKKNIDPVEMAYMNSHYEVTLDFNSNVSHKQMGEEYGKEIAKILPDFPALMDSYLSELTYNNNTYNFFISRVKDFIPQIQADYRDEIDGLISQLSGTTENIRGDNKLSPDEFYLVNLIPDIMRTTQCSALSVYGELSENKKTMASRVLDWPAGTKYQMEKMQCVMTIKDKNKSICTIGYVGFMGVITGFNDNRVFAAILDSSTGKEYTSSEKHSYPLELRYALENYKDLDDVADFMISPENNFAFSHLIYLADEKTSKVVENNISSGENCLRSIRSDDSVLNAGADWNLKNSIGCVNSFVLKGNLDNHTSQKLNTARWDKMKEQVVSKGNVITLDELRDIISFDNGNGPGYMKDGDLYNKSTQQIVIYLPHSNYLEVFFKASSGSLPEDPVFEPIDVRF